MDRILEDREKRYEKILSLIVKYKLPVICGKINYPGSNKNTEEAEIAFKLLGEKLNSKFRSFVVYSETIGGFDGNSMLMVTALTPEKSKRMAASIEEIKPIGRVFDIDVYLEDGSPLSRKDIGLQPRSCIICGMDAKICTRNKSHSLVETLDEINRIIREANSNNR